MAYRVKAVTAVIKVGGTEKYLHRGSIVPSSATNVEHLLAVGLLEEIDLLTTEVPEADSPADEAQSAAQSSGTDGDPAPAPPAKSGPGSGAEAWRNYAAALEVEVAEDASRDDVLAALEAADKPTE